MTWQKCRVTFCQQFVTMGSSDNHEEDEDDLTVAEQLEKANKNLSKGRWTHPTDSNHHSHHHYKLYKHTHFPWNDDWWKHDDSQAHSGHEGHIFFVRVSRFVDVIGNSERHCTQEGHNMLSFLISFLCRHQCFCFLTLSADHNRHGIRINGDIAMSSLPAKREAEPCVLHGCMWPKDTDGKVYVPYVIANHYCKHLHTSSVDWALYIYDTLHILYIVG